ncbi:cytochrome P450 [Rubrobacter tropicus]|uniref:Cytochrome P450 n=1 Tax=Rubrobacter tropicus TaxID=2653851 RepID=A0A6G8QBM0_9ACTN|nr:cytochrome P450 [Rubrobacter tropicus]QIN83833.1 cytochrome P450 [Rubrobacter tropicus]
MSATISNGRGYAGRTPGPRGNPILGSMRDFQRDKLGFVQSLTRYGDVARYRTAHLTWYQINHPEGVRRVLQENNRNYGKGALTLNFFKPVVGEGLLTSEGALWLRQRRLIQPVFHRKSVASFGGLMTGETLAMLERWRPALGTGKPLDVQAEMARLTLDVVTGALFHAHVGEEPEVIGRAISTLVEDTGYRFEVPFYPPHRVPTPRNRRFRAALRTVDRAVYSIIAERRRGGGDEEDLLALLMGTRDEETGEAMNDKQLRDEVITLFLAGHETTANALSWTFYLLAANPEAEERLRAELYEALGADRRVPALEDLPKLAYTKMVVDETLRLYPPAWITNRQAIAEDDILGHRIPAKSFVTLSPYVLHRHPDYWDRPDEFDPERFAPGRHDKRPRFAYFPFGGGPRQCIGQSMALVEAQLVLATILGRCRLRPIPGRPVEAQALATLRPRGGLPMTVEAA